MAKYTTGPTGGSHDEYRGGWSQGDGWGIAWGSPVTRGPEPIEVVRGVIDNLQHRQRTTAATEQNAKLLYRLTRAVDEYDGNLPNNDLIPKSPAKDK